MRTLSFKLICSVSGLFCLFVFVHLSYLLFILGIYEIFSKEVFGIKVKNLEFGLQPHKVPDTETVSIDTEKQKQVTPF